jgi:hypothetical protein
MGASRTAPTGLHASVALLEVLRAALGSGDFADAAARDTADERVDLGDSAGQATVFASQFVTFE